MNGKTETANLSASKQKKLERAKKRAKTKRAELARKIVGFAILVALAGGILFLLISNMIQAARSVTASGDYSALLTDDGFIQGVQASDQVSLADYKNLTAPLSEIEYSDASVETEIASLLESYAEVNTETDAKIADGDKVSIEYVGTVDGVEFEGGNTGGTPTDLTIGSGQYVDDFEQQLIGHGIGETVIVAVTFPEDYGNEELNGKDAVFTVEIDGIYETPAFTDEFVAENLSDQANTAEGYRAYLKETKYQENLKNWVENALVEQTVVNQYPKAYLKKLKQVQKYDDQQMFTQTNQFAMQIYGYSMYASFEDYVGMSEAEYDESLEETCKTKEAEDLTYQAILEAEGVRVTEADYKAYLTEKNGSTDSFGSDVETYGLPYTMKKMVKEKAIEIALSHVTVQ